MFWLSALLSSQTFAVTCTKQSLLGLVPWYQYLTYAPKNVSGSNVSTCAITNFDSGSNVLGPHSAFLLIGLAVLDDLLRVAAYVAIGYIIYGGIQYVVSQGSPDATRKAQQTILNALIGLAIAIVASSIVAFIGNKLGS